MASNSVARFSAPSVIGIDEISIGNCFRLPDHRERLGPRSASIWFSGTDRSEASMDEFFAGSARRNTRKINLAVMDMWKAFRKSTLKEGHAPQARIVYDKFHVLSHLGKAMDKVQKQVYLDSQGRNRRFIKGQKYNLLSRWENLTIEEKPRVEAAVRGRR